MGRGDCGHRQCHFAASYLSRPRPRNRMLVWISSPTSRNPDAARAACRLRHSDLRSGRSSRGQDSSPGTPLSGAAEVGRDDGPPRVTPAAMPPGGPVARPARWGRRRFQAPSVRPSVSTAKEPTGHRNVEARPGEPTGRRNSGIGNRPLDERMSRPMSWRPSPAWNIANKLGREPEPI